MPASPPVASGVVRLTQAQIDAGLWYDFGYRLTESQFTYSIATAGAAWTGYDPGDEPSTGYVAFTAQQGTQFARAIATWDEYIAPGFTRADDTANSGTIRIAFTDSGADAEFAAYTYVASARTSKNPISSDIWINSDVSPPSRTSFAAGGYDYETLLHEAGHAIGLKHSFEDTPVPALYDTTRYTVMSYTETDEYVVSFEVRPGTATLQKTLVVPATPMVLDILAIQDIYGADRTTRTGDDTYSSFAADDRPALQTIYDAGGSDTLLGSTNRNNLIDLRPGAYSSIGYWSREDQITYWQGRTAGYGVSADFIAGQFGVDTYTWRDNVGIAFGTVIENATGGWADDVLIGNDVANRLTGNEGNDVLTGGGGADELFGGFFDADVYRDTAAGLDGDFIRYLDRLDTIHITDLAFGSFTIGIGNQRFQPASPYVVLLSTGQSFSYQSSFLGRLAASADPSGGTDLRLVTLESARSDVNGDGFSDLLWRNVNGDLSTWHVVDEGGRVGTQQNRAYFAGVAPAWEVQEAVDLDFDGDADILWHNREDGRVAIWKADGSGGYDQASYLSHPNDLGWQVAGTGDVDGDGLPDILWRHRDGYVTYWHGDGGSAPRPAEIRGVEKTWHIQGVGDINGDGRADIVWRNEDGRLAIWNGFDRADLVDTRIESAWHVAAIADFDGDARADILWRHDNGTISLWTAEGTDFRRNSYSDASVGNSWHIVGTGDYNADGRSDVLWRHEGGAFSIWEGTYVPGFVQGAYTDSSVGLDWSIVTNRFDLI